jgi:hypothetical protein
MVAAAEAVLVLLDHPLEGPLGVRLVLEHRDKEILEELEEQVLMELVEMACFPQ